MESKTETDTEEYLDTVTKPVRDLEIKQNPNTTQNAESEVLNQSPENTLGKCSTYFN